jgi:hypothetical protein
MKLGGGTSDSATPTSSRWKKMVKLEMVHEPPPISHVEQFYNTCVLAKHRRSAFP